MTESITRLHISPLTPASLDSILAPSTRPLATNISFHTIPTFPENDYGFVSLPSMEADKLKKKLNGSILKGKKLKVEVAKADPKERKKKTADIEDNDVEKNHLPSKSGITKSSSKRKAEDNVLDGYELPTDRHVKRGWTEPKKFKKQNKADKDSKNTKSQSKSKYTEKAECLFKAKIPPNKISDSSAATKKSTKSKKSKAPNETVVHEFSQTVSHPSFLKSTTGGKPVTASFEEGKGWIDEDGNVQEADNRKSRKMAYHPVKTDSAKERVDIKEKSAEKSLSKSEEDDQESDWTSSSGSSDDETSASEDDTDSDSDSDVSSDNDASSLSDYEEKATATNMQENKSDDKIKNVTHSDASEAEETTSASEESDDDENNEDEEESDDAESEDSSKVEKESKSSAPAKPVEITTEAQDVHPLEALFKRKRSEEEEKGVTEEVNNTFSFFAGNSDDIEEDEEEEAQPESLEPMTPFTKRDRQIRDLRSGAPTPDTAVFNRRKNILSNESDEDNNDMDDADDDDFDHAKETLNDETPSKSRDPTVLQQQPGESDFSKWFWEHRGENNRAWKRRRREAAKEKRQRENRRKGMKGRG